MDVRRYRCRDRRVRVQVLQINGFYILKESNTSRERGVGVSQQGQPDRITTRPLLVLGDRSDGPGDRIMPGDNLEEVGLNEVGVVETGLHDAGVPVLHQGEQYITGGYFCERSFDAERHGRYFFHDDVLDLMPEGERQEVTAAYFCEIEQTKVARDRERDEQRGLRVFGQGQPDRVAFGPPFVFCDRLKNVSGKVLPVRKKRFYNPRRRVVDEEGYLVFFCR